MPLMAAPAPTWADKINDDIFKAKEEAGRDLTATAGILNEKYGWSMNDFKVRALVKSKYPDLYKAWKAKYGQFFKMEPWKIILGVGVIVAGAFYWATRKKVA